MKPARAKELVRLARRLQSVAPPSLTPPSEVVAPVDQPVLPHSLFRGTRGYIEKVVHQVNSTYQHTCYDACAVMIRRLVEMLIIETFEHHKLEKKIQNADGDFLMLADLITAVLNQKTWSLGRQTKKALRQLKTIGDQSAHGRRYNAKREYIDDVIIDLRTVAEELLYLSGLRT